MAVTASNPLSSYSQAQINAAAQKIISTNPTYKNYNVSGLVAAAQSKPSLMTELTTGLKAATATPATTTAAAKITLPDPKTATTWSTTAGGKTYYLSVPQPGQAQTWMERSSNGTSLLPVDTSGKPIPNTPGTNFSSWQTASSSGRTPQQVAAAVAPKPVTPTPAATTTAPKPATTTPAAPAVVTPPASLNLPAATTAMSLILARNPAAPPTMKTDSATGTAYYLVPPSGNQPAQWVSVPRGATVASNGQSLQAINTAQNSYITANQVKAPTPAAAPAPAAPVAPTPVAAPALTVAQQATIQNPILQKMNAATSQAEFDSLVQQAAAAGAPLNTGQISSSQTALTQRLAKPVTPTPTPAAAPAPTPAPAVPAAPTLSIAQQATIQQPILAKMNTVTTQAELDSLVKQAADAGAPINAGQISSYQTALNQRITAAQEEQAARMRGQYFSQLDAAQTQEDFDRILAEAKSANVSLNAGQVDSRRQGLATRLQQAEQQRVQQLTQQYQTQLGQAQTQQDVDRIVNEARTQGAVLPQAVIDKQSGVIKQREQTTAEIASTIQGTALGDTGRSIYTKSGVEIATLPDDPTTGAKGGYYLYNGQGFQQLDASGQATGAVIPRDEFNQLQRTRVSGVAEYQRYQQRLADETKMAEQVKNFEAALPQPGSEQFNYLLANRFMLDGPDGRVYELVAKNEKTGEAGGWLVSTAPGVNPSDPKAQYTRLGQPETVVSKADINQVFTQNAEIIDARNKAERAAQIAAQQKASRIDFGDTMRFALGAIGLIYGASLLAELGTAAASAATETAATMAGTGSTAAEIGSTLEALYGVSPELASGIAGEAAASVGMSEAAFAAADAAQLAAQGLSQAAIEQNLVFSGLNAGAAAEAAAMAVSGLSETAIAQGLSDALGSAPMYSSGPVSPPTSVAQAPTSPTAPGPTETGVLEAAGPAQPQGPIDVASTGVSDAAPGTVIQGPNGPEVVLDSGKTVDLAQYTEAVTSGQPVTVDGMATTSYTPEQITRIEQLQAQGYTPQQIGEMIEPYTGQNLKMDVLGVAEPYMLPEVVVTAPPYGIEDFIADLAIPGAVLGSAAILGGGGGGAAAGAPAATTPTAPVEPAPQPQPTEPQPQPTEPQPQPTEPQPQPTEPQPQPTEPQPQPTEPQPQPTEPAPAPTQPVEPAPAPTQPVEPAPAPTQPSTGPGTVQEIPPGSTTPSGPVQPLPDQTVTPVDVTTPTVPPETPIVPPVTPPAGPTTPTTPPTEPVTPTEPTTPPGEQPPAEIIDRSVPYDPNQPPGDLLKALKDIYGEIPWWAKLGVSLYGLSGVPQIELPEYGPIGPTQWGTVGTVNLPGVNPGFFTTPSARYQATSPVQSRFSWEQRPLQTGTEYNAAQWNAPGTAPATPFGLQQMYQPLDINQYLAELNAPAGPVAPQTRA